MQCSIEICQYNKFTFCLIVNVSLDIRWQNELNWGLILIVKLELQIVDGIDVHVHLGSFKFDIDVFVFEYLSSIQVYVHDWTRVIVVKAGFYCDVFAASTHSLGSAEIIDIAPVVILNTESVAILYATYAVIVKLS